MGIARDGRACLAAALAVSWVLAAPSVMAAPPDTAFAEGGVVRVSGSGEWLSVHATESAWSVVLEEFHRRTGVALRVAPAPEGTVTVAIESVPVERVLHLLFGPDASFVYVYRSASDSGRPAVLDEVLITRRAWTGSAPARAGAGYPRDVDQPGATDSTREAAGATPPNGPTEDDASPPVASLWHEDPDVRRQALDEVVERGDGSGVAEVERVLSTDREHEVRARAVKALMRIGTPEALEALRPAMSDSEVTVRLGAVDAIASFETPRARALLGEALRDRDEQVRVSAGAALRSLASSGR